eukprot:scaffold34315_cov32-Tisochrysis_lutea.AAC.2
MVQKSLNSLLAIVAIELVRQRAASCSPCPRRSAGWEVDATEGAPSKKTWAGWKSSRPTSDHPAGARVMPKKTTTARADPSSSTCRAMTLPMTCGGGVSGRWVMYLWVA